MKTFLLISFFSFILPSLRLADISPVDEDGSVSFTVKNLGINTSGEIKGLKGSIQWDEANVSKSSMNVSVDVSTINTGIEMRDSHLKKAEYFDADKFPQISFKSSAVTATSVSGTLTIKGVSKNISFPYTVKKSNDGYLFEGSFSIDRKDFGVGGSFTTISNNVDVQLHVMAK